MNHRTAQLVIGALAALSGIVAFIGFIENRKHKEIKDEIVKMEHDLKLLQIEKVKTQLANGGVNKA